MHALLTCLRRWTPRSGPSSTDPQFLAAANYNDDGPEQTWQFDVGFAIVRFGLPVLIAVGIITVISALRSDR